MKLKSKTVFLIVLVICMIFSLVPITAIEYTGDNTYENWELELNLYNKNSGIVQDRNINWDASNGSYLKSEQKEIIFQINYRNNNVQKKYFPGDLIIEIPNILYGSEKEQIKYQIRTSTNTSNQSGYEFSYIGDEDFNSVEFLTFSNDDEIVSNIEGSFQISYTISFEGDNKSKNDYDEDKFYPESYDDSCYHYFESSTYATLNGHLKTDDISIILERTYNHPWQIQDFSLETKLVNCNINDEIINNKNDYIWVGYRYRIPEIDYCSSIDNKEYKSTYPYYKPNIWKIETSFPDECIVLNSEHNIISNNVSSTDFKILDEGIISDNTIYVGYPKSIYNEENDNYLVHNNAILYVDYECVGIKKMSENDIDVNLGEFNFYYGNGDSIYLSIMEFSGTTKYSELMMAPYHKYWSMNDARSTWWIMPMSAKFTNTITDVIIGADKFFITGPDGEYKVLDDEEYYFQYINFPGTLYDGFGRSILDDTYDVELYVRERGHDKYYLYDTFKNHKSEYGLQTGREEKIVSFFFLIKDVKNGISTIKDGIWETKDPFSFTISIECAEIAKQGNLVAFDYLTVKDKDGNLLTPHSIESYDEFSKTLLAPLDIENHGQYLYRWTDDKEYTTIDNFKAEFELLAKKDMKINSQDEKNEEFLGKANLHFSKGYSNYPSGIFNGVFNYIELVNDKQKIKGFEAYDLLPYGMKLESSADEIIESMIGPDERCFNLAYNDKIVQDLLPQLKESCKIEIVENWNETGRTWIHIKFDFGDNTVVIDPIVGTDINYLQLSYNFSISYDAFMENNSYNNNLYLKWIDNDFFLRNEMQDDGEIDIDAVDIDNNGLTTDNFSVGSSSLTINSLVSCRQGIQKYVQTDKNNFTTDLAESSLNTNYQYKLRVNTGSTYVKDLIIYDNIETAFGNNTHWSGEFSGIDTSYAESKGYKIEIYYSTKTNAGTLDKDLSWKIFSEDIDENNVKSLAFKFLDKNGDSAVLPVNSMIYVIVEMKSPDKYKKGKTYNSSFSEWTPVDEFGNPVGGIVGLTSNIVSVELSKPQEINLYFNKKIDGENEVFDEFKLDPNDRYSFFISLTNQETGEVINGLLDSKEGFHVNNIPVGTYIIKEHNDIWFEFVNMILLKSIKGIDLQERNGEYILIIDETVEPDAIVEIKIINKLHTERFYDSKYNKKNIFVLKNKL